MFSEVEGLLWATMDNLCRKMRSTISDHQLIERTIEQILLLLFYVCIWIKTLRLTNRWLDREGISLWRITHVTQSSCPLESVAAMLASYIDSKLWRALIGRVISNTLTRCWYTYKSLRSTTLCNLTARKGSVITKEYSSRSTEILEVTLSGGKRPRIFFSFFQVPSK